MNKEEIKKIYQEFRTPQNIIDHMEAVAKFCEFLAAKLAKKGFEIQKEEVINAALLHDTVRICDIRDFDPANFPDGKNPETVKIWQELRNKYQKIGHEKAMAKILHQRNEDYLANLIEKHGFLEVDNLETLEEKILYYADKRFDGDKIVSLDERFREGKKRNLRPEDNLARIQQTEEKIKLLEKELQSLASF